MPTSVLGDVRVVGGLPSTHTARRRRAPRLRWDGLTLYREGRKRPLATVIPDEDSPYLWHVRRRDGFVTEAMSLARARAYACDEAAGAP